MGQNKLENVEDETPMVHALVAFCDAGEKPVGVARSRNLRFVGARPARVAVRTLVESVDMGLLSMETAKTVAGAAFRRASGQAITTIDTAAMQQAYQSTVGKEYRNAAPAGIADPGAIRQRRIAEALFGKWTPQ